MRSLHLNPAATATAVGITALVLLTLALVPALIPTLTLKLTLMLAAGADHLMH